MQRDEVRCAGRLRCHSRGRGGRHWEGKEVKRLRGRLKTHYACNLALHLDDLFPKKIGACHWRQLRGRFAVGMPSADGCQTVAVSWASSGHSGSLMAELLGWVDAMPGALHVPGPVEVIVDGTRSSFSTLTPKGL